MKIFTMYMYKPKTTQYAVYICIRIRFLPRIHCANKQLTTEPFIIGRPTPAEIHKITNIYMHVDTMAAICFSEMQRHFKGEWQFYIRWLLMRHLDLQILLSASYREKAENKTTLQNSRFGAWHTGQKRSQKNFWLFSWIIRAKQQAGMLPVEVMEKGHFTDKRSVHGASHIVIFTHFPSSFSSNILIIGDIFQAVSLESRHVG